MAAREARAAALAALAAVCLLVAGLCAGEDLDGGWRVRSTGWFVSLPERSVRAMPDGVEAEAVLAPGTGFRLERDVTPGRPVPGIVALTLSADNVNVTSRDYEPGGARFPLSFSLVFGKDRPDLSWRRRALEFVASLWRGLPSRGIRLTYAWGNEAPVGSMYRRGEGETVFVLGGKESGRGAVTARRNPVEDFAAAYGRAPRGPVTQVIVRAERPRGERGSVRVRIAASLGGD